MRVDFSSLVRTHPELAQYVPFDFSDECQRALTTALLEDHGVKVRLERDRLCPAFFNRFDYLKLMERLMDRTVGDKDKWAALDVGTGHSAVYCLLGMAEIDRLKWVLGTDIDGYGLQLAQANVDLNEYNVSLEKVERDKNAFESFCNQLTDQVAFTVCNPPFYGSSDEMEAKRVSKYNLKAPVTGKQTELVTPGGELAFVWKLYKDSIEWHRQIVWFSSMVGNLSTVKSLIRKFDVDLNYGVYEFISGSSTKRWIIYWSFGAIQPPVELYNTVKPRIIRIIRRPMSLETVILKIRDLPFTRIVEGVHSVSLTLPGLCWTRAYRRGHECSSEDYKFTVDCLEQQTNVIWCVGTNSKVFESFIGYLNRIK